MQGTISLWLSQALAVYEHFYRDAPVPPVLAGSSMSGWITLRMVQALLERGRPAGGLVLLGPRGGFH